MSQEELINTHRKYFSKRNACDLSKYCFRKIHTHCYADDAMGWPTLVLCLCEKHGLEFTGTTETIVYSGEHPELLDQA